MRISNPRCTREKLPPVAGGGFQIRGAHAFFDVLEVADGGFQIRGAPPQLFAWGLKSSMHLELAASETVREVYAISTV